MHFHIIAQFSFPMGCNYIEVPLVKLCHKCTNRGLKGPDGRWCIWPSSRPRASSRTEPVMVWSRICGNSSKALLLQYHTLFQYFFNGCGGSLKTTIMYRIHSMNYRRDRIQEVHTWDSRRLLEFQGCVKALWASFNSACTLCLTIIHKNPAVFVETHQDGNICFL